MRPSVLAGRNPPQGADYMTPGDVSAIEAARLGCERLHERTIALYWRMAVRDGTDAVTAMIRAQHGPDAAARWAA